MRGGRGCGRLPAVTTTEVVAHWRKRARDSLELARLAIEVSNYCDALFHCHLAVEKCLKAQIMETTKKPHPRIHGLPKLASILQNDWSKEDKELLSFLSDFAVAARYDDPAWAERVATAQNAEEWVARTDTFLSKNHV